MYYEREDKGSDDWLSGPTDKGRKVWYMSRMRKYLDRHIALQYVLRRLISLIPILLGVTILTYGLMYISPQDPVEMMLQGQGTAPDPEVVAAMRHQLGLDRPFLVQYFDWLWRFVRGDMGVSYIDGAAVSGKLLQALPNTLKLTFSSVIVTILLSVPLGILAAVKKGRVTDAVIRFLSFIGNSLPNFVVSLLLLYFFALKLGWFPIFIVRVTDQSGAADACACDPDDRKIHPSGAGRSSGTAWQTVCGRCRFQRLKAPEGIVWLCSAECAGHDYYADVHVNWFPAWRNSCN